jgi:hypothetical protein
MSQSEADGYQQENNRQFVPELNTHTVEWYCQFARSFPDDYCLLTLASASDRDAMSWCRRGSAPFCGDWRSFKTGLMTPAVHSNNIRWLSTSTPIHDEISDVIVAGAFPAQHRSKDINSTIFAFYRIREVGGRLILTAAKSHAVNLRVRSRNTYGSGDLTQDHASNVLTARGCMGSSGSGGEAAEKLPPPCRRTSPLLPLTDSSGQILNGQL